MCVLINREKKVWREGGRRRRFGGKGAGGEEGAVGSAPQVGRDLLYQELAHFLC